MEGLKEEVDKAKDKIFELLRRFQKERWLDEEAKLVADTVQWSIMVCKYCHHPKPVILNSGLAQFLTPRSNEEGGILFYPCVSVCNKISVAFFSATIHGKCLKF